VPYNFSSLPEVTSVDELRAHLNEELQRISQNFNETIELELRASKHAPDRPREGMIIHADGTNWNPGSGQGTYRYQNGVWVKVPSTASDLGSLWGPGHAIALSSSPVTLTVGQSGNQITNFNANRTVNLPTTSGNAGVCYSFYTLDGGSGGNLTVTTFTGTELLLLPDGNTTASLVLTTQQRMLIVCEGSHWVVLGTNFRGAFPQGNGVLWDSTSLRTVQQMSITADGSGLKLSGDATSPGNSQYYGTDSGGTKGYFALASGGITLIADAVGFPAAATWSITSLGGYKAWMVDMQGVSQSSGTSRSFQAALSGNNGSSYGSVRNPIGPTGLTSGSTTNLRFFISRIDKTNNQMLWMSSFISGGNQIETGSLGPINAIQFSWSGAATNFTAGVADIYGIK
jgi:hypothetical protein